MLEGNKIRIAQGEDNPCYLLLNQANRHGLIAGASGTGKTVTFKVMAEGLSQAGVPIFMADVKGDVGGLAEPGVDNEGMQKRIKKFGLEETWSYRGCPMRLWDIMDGSGGAPVRITVSDMGPVMLARMLGLTDVQEGVLNIVFRIADENRWLLIDLKDLRAMLNYVSERADEYQTTYGNVSAQSVGAILRALIAVEDQGGDIFFGEPNIDLTDWFATDQNGHGYINVLSAVKLVQAPQIYSMFMLWMLTELYNTLPEVGDPEKPVFAFFFDEAHLLFNDMPKELLTKIVQVVKLVRSKGVGVYFITQSPSDIPNEVLAQLSNRVQHGLRAYTPAEQKAVRAAADAFRANPKFNAADVILELGTGEALVSFLDEDGKPSVVENAKILPPQCLMAAPSDETVQAVLAAQADLMTKYGEAVDPLSAYEIITYGSVDAAQAAMEETASDEERPADPTPSRVELEAAAKAARAEAEKAEKEAAAAQKELERQRKLAEKEALAAQKAAEKAEAEAKKEAERAAAAAQKEAERQQKERDKRNAQIQREVTKVASNVITSVGRTAGNALVRGILGSLKK